VSERRLGLLFAGAPRVPEMVRLAQRAEARGFDSIWIAETRMTRDGFVPAAAVAMGTERVRVATGIVNVFTRGPVVLAISFLSLAEIAPGRIVMGLGTGSPLVLAPQGIAFERAVPRLREYCEVLPPLVRGEEVAYEGEAVSLLGARVEDLLHGEDGNAAGGAGLPLVLGVTGRWAVELAGELADGVLFNVCLPIAYVERAREWLAAGATRVGRDPDEIEVAMAVVASPAADARAGKDRARRFVALYLSLFPNIAKETGLDAAFMDEVRAAFGRDGLDAAVPLVPDDVVDLLTASGTVEQCQARLDEYRAAGVDVPVLVALEDSVELAIDTLS
jgi:5,10-methylenetetrahydromethanopterin reductase